MYKDENCRWGVLKEYVRELTLISMQDEQVGDCAEVGEWAAKFDLPILGPEDVPDALHVKEAIQYCLPRRARPGTLLVLNADELAALRESGAIYTETDTGNRTITWYHDQEKLDAAWDKLAAILELEADED